MLKWVAFAGFATVAVAAELAYQRSAPNAHAQEARSGNGGPSVPGSEGPRGRDSRGGPGFGGPGGFGPGGPGGFGGPMGGPDLELVSKYDKDENGWLNNEERQAARDFLKSQPGGGRRGPGGGPGRGGMPQPGEAFGAALLAALDTNHDEQVSAAESRSGLKSFLVSAFGKSSRSLAVAELAEGLQSVIPFPNMGGRPGGGGPEGPGQRPEQRPEQSAQRGPEGPRGEGRRPAGEGPEAERPGPRGERGGPEGPMPGGPGFGGGFGGPGFGPPGGMGGGRGRGFGPGQMIAAVLFQKAGQSLDDKLSITALEKTVDTLFREADKDNDTQLTSAELTAGIDSLFASARPMGPGPGGPGGGGPGGGRREPGTPGPKVDPASVKTYGDESLYDPSTLRTLFLTFENADWEKELEQFHGTDVEVPATLLVDGKTYPNVGVHFRGMSSYGGVPTGSKRSLNLTTDLADSKQRLLGYKTLNLLNAHEDSSFLSSVLYSHIARKRIPAPKANFVKVVINGESWGVYVNVQQFNKEFLAENYPTSTGARWKVQGSPGGGGGLEYLGENVEDYKRRYEIKTKDNEKSWKAFVNLCRVLNETPTTELEAALEPILDIDQTLWFLALDVALCNHDGYWVRASDYSLYLDPEGRFHPIPHDMNEAFRAGGGGPGGPGGGGMRGPGGPQAGGPGGRGPGGPEGGPERRDDRRGGGEGGRGRGGFGGPRGGGGIDLDPLVALDDPTKPLRSRLLAVPKLRAQYMAHVRTIAEQDLNWPTLQPVVEQYRLLIADEIRKDTRKLSSFDEFERALSPDEPRPGAARDREMSLRTFVEQRQTSLLKHPAFAKD